MLAVVARLRERGDLEDVALDRVERRPGRRTAPRRCSSLPHSGGGCAPGGGGGGTASSSGTARRACPPASSSAARSSRRGGRRARARRRRPGGAARTSRRSRTSRRRRTRPRTAGSRRRPRPTRASRPSASARLRPGLEQLGRQVAGGHLGARARPPAVRRCRCRMRRRARASPGDTARVDEPRPDRHQEHLDHRGVVAGAPRRAVARLELRVGELRRHRSPPIRWFRRNCAPARGGAHRENALSGSLSRGRRARGEGRGLGAVARRRASRGCGSRGGPRSSR